MQIDDILFSGEQTRKNIEVLDTQLVRIDEELAICAKLKAAEIVAKMTALAADLNANLKPSRVSSELIAALAADPLNEGAILEAHGHSYNPTSQDRQEMLTWQLGEMVPNGDLETDGAFVVRQPVELNRPVGEEDETEAVAGGWLLWVGDETLAERFGSAEELAKAILETEAGR